MRSLPLSLLLIAAPAAGFIRRAVGFACRFQDNSARG